MSKYGLAFPLVLPLVSLVPSLQSRNVLRSSAQAITAVSLPLYTVPYAQNVSLTAGEILYGSGHAACGLTAGRNGVLPRSTYQEVANIDQPIKLTGAWHVFSLPI